MVLRQVYHLDDQDAHALDVVHQDHQGVGLAEVHQDHQASVGVDAG